MLKYMKWNDLSPEVLDALTLKVFKEEIGPPFV